MVKTPYNIKVTLHNLFIGADDIDQLKELDEEEFEQLSVMVGMNRKPFHILRLKKALAKYNPSITEPHTTPESVTMPTPSETTTPSSSASNFSGQSLISLPWQMQSSKSSPVDHHLEECPLGTSIDVAKSALSQGPSKAFLDAMEACGHNLPSEKDFRCSPRVSDLDHSSRGVKRGQGSVERVKSVFLPSYLKEDSVERGFSELVDEHTPIQKTLCTSPFLPSMWDPERKELVRKYSCIYGKNSNRRQKEILSSFEEQVNEGSYQLCLRDPTLLVRREELFCLAKKALKEGGYYSHGYSKGKDLESTIATTGQKRSREDERDGGEQSHSRVLTIPTPKIISPGSLADELPKKLSGRMRQEKMIELESLISSNKSQQAAKLVELEKAQQLGHFSSAFSIQLEVESLGSACHQLQSSLAALKRKQRRSERYYTLKAREGVRMDINQMSADYADGRTRRDMSPPFKSAPGISDDDEHGQGADFERYESGKKVIVVHSPATGRPAVTARVIPKLLNTMPTSQGTIGVCTSPESNDQEVRDLVKNVSNATDEVNSLMIREFQKQLEWDL